MWFFGWSCQTCRFSCCFWMLLEPMVLQPGPGTFLRWAMARLGGLLLLVAGAPPDVARIISWFPTAKIQQHQQHFVIFVLPWVFRPMNYNKSLLARVGGRIHVNSTRQAGSRICWTLMASQMWLGVFFWYLTFNDFPSLPSPSHPASRHLCIPHHIPLKFISQKLRDTLNSFGTKENTAEKGTCFSLSIVAFSDPKYCCHFLQWQDVTRLWPSSTILAMAQDSSKQEICAEWPERWDA